MKKAFVYLSALAFIAVLATSCKSREHCPAYGSNTQEAPQAEKSL